MQPELQLRPPVKTRQNAPFPAPVGIAEQSAARASIPLKKGKVSAGRIDLAGKNHSNDKNPSLFQRAAGRVRSIVPLVLLLGLPLAGLAAAVAWLTLPSKHQPQALATETVSRGALDITVTERGNVDSANNLTLRSLVEGGTGTAILKIAEEGSKVAAGQIVVELDSARLRDEAVAQQIRLDSALAAFKMAEADVAIQRMQNDSDEAAAALKLELARLDLASYKEADSVQQMQLVINEIKTAAEYLTRATERWAFSQKLMRKGYTTTKVLDADRVAVARARIDLDTAQEKHRVIDRFTHRRDLTERESNLVFCEQELERVKLRGKAALTQRERIFLARKRSHFLEDLRHKKLLAQIEACTIRAPREGLVVHANTLDGGRTSPTPLIYEGSTVRERQPVIHLPDLTRMRINARVHETKVTMLSEGLDVTVHVDACGEETFHGVVEQVALVPNSGAWPNINVKEYTTTIGLGDDAEKLALLKPGMTAEVEIHVDHLEGVLQAPIQSCVERGGRYFAWVQEDDFDLTRHEIQLGKSNDTTAEIVAGLDEGDKVVLNPRSVLPDEIALLEQEIALVEEESPQHLPVVPRPAPVRDAAPARDGETSPGKSGDVQPQEPGIRPRSDEKFLKSPGDRQPATVLIMAALPDDGKPMAKGADDPMRVFNSLDKNHDAKVTESELPDPMKPVLPRLDTNGDHFIDKDEWKKGTCTVPANPEG